MAISGNRLKIFAGLTIIFFGVSARFFLVEYIRIPNVEIVTTLSLISGMFLGGIYSILVPLFIMFVSDMAIGNGGIVIFTWSAFIIISIFGSICEQYIGKFGYKGSAIIALISSLFFFIYTNFGWWLMSGMYEYSLNGLIKCYIAGLPFLKNNLFGNLVFVPVLIAIAHQLFDKKKNISLINLQKRIQMKYYRG